MDLALERIEREDGVCVAVAGEVDAYTAPRMLAELLAAIERDPRLTLDLSAVTFMDSQGLATLLRARQEAEARGGTLRLDRVSVRVLKLLQLTRMDSLFPVVAAPADGVAG
jgi:anti-sigma B factor antagonist